MPAIISWLGYSTRFPKVFNTLSCLKTNQLRGVWRQFYLSCQFYPGMTGSYPVGDALNTISTHYLSPNNEIRPFHPGTDHYRSLVHSCSNPDLYLDTA